MTELTDEQYGRISRALNEYCFFGIEPDLSGNEKIIFTMAKYNIDASNRSKMGGKNGGKKGRGGAPEGNQNAKRKKTIPPYCDEQYPPIEPAIEKNNSNGNGNGNVNVNGNANDSGDSDESPSKKSASKQKSNKSKKPPLREREPVNDMERVEKAYILNWDSLFSQGRVKTNDPVVNWNQARALLKKHFEKLKPDQIIQALKNGMTDDWVMNKGYSLGIMLSASVLNRLINAGGKGSPPSLEDKKSLGGLDSW
jgi:hypothetical protein